MYADDCILFMSGNNWNIMRNLIQPDLDNKQMWCEQNRMKLSISKSKSLLIGSISKLKHMDYAQNLSLNDLELDIEPWHGGQSLKY